MPCIHAEPRVGNGNREPCFHGDTATTYDMPPDASDVYLNGARFPG